MFEYTLINGVNDSIENAKNLLNNETSTLYG
jgi:adenine C2-methylase RlmN of 23S rRNA A2503 and tRNA A37